MDTNNKQNYIPVGKKKVYVEKNIFDAFNRLRRKQAYSNNKFRNNTVPILEGDESIQVFDVEEEAIKNLLIEQLLRAISKLTEDEKKLIKLYYFEGKTEREIAKEINIPQTIINYRKEQLIIKLRNFINK